MEEHLLISKPKIQINAPENLSQETITFPTSSKESIKSIKSSNSNILKQSQREIIEKEIIDVLNSDIIHNQYLDSDILTIPVSDLLGSEVFSAKSKKEIEFEINLAKNSQKNSNKEIEKIEKSEKNEDLSGKTIDGYL